jgi:hypothetical protein
VLLDYRAFRAGGSPGQVVLSCTCVDYPVDPIYLN